MLLDTKPYNADFDGDEMNLHMPQNDISEVELKNLAAIPYQIISPAKSSSIVGIFQDSMVGTFRFTRKDIKFPIRKAMNLLMKCESVNEDVLKSIGDSVTNFEILSQILPSMTLKHTSLCLIQAMKIKKIQIMFLKLKTVKFYKDILKKDY